MLTVDHFQTGPGQEDNSHESAPRSGFYAYGIGTAIGGRYRVRDQAAGTYGHIYLCYDQEQDYFYALKTLYLHQKALDDPKTFPRMQREVNIWIGLGQHDHIVRCFGFELLDNLPFAILEWVADNDILSRLYHEYHSDGPLFLDWYARLGSKGLLLRQEQASRNRESGGTSLSAWLLRHPRGLPLDFSLQVALDICAGMQYAQEVHPGLVHRDLKPANVLLTEQLRAKVSDFGTAILIEDLLEPGLPVGTMEYMAPEQWTGKSPDARADIYALGCILYTMLVGTPPFVSPTRDEEELQRLHLYAPPPRLSRRFPKTVDEIVQRCLHKEPSGRFSSFDELALALTNVYGTVTGTLPRTATGGLAESVESINRVALTYLNLERYETALAQFERAIELNGSYPNTYTNRGCVYHALGQHEAARSDYTNAIRLGRSSINAKVRNNRGLLNISLGQFSQAIDDLEQAIEIEPDYANAYVNRGLAYVALRQYEDALADFRRALELNPTHVLAHHNCGYVHQQQNQYDKALGEYKAAIEHDPYCWQAYLNRALVFQQRGQHELAAQNIAQFAKLRGLKCVDISDLKPEFCWGRPDPQLLNIHSLQDTIVPPITEAERELRKWSELGGERSAPAGRMPLRSLITIKEIEYSATLHGSVRKRQENGEILTQVTAAVEIWLDVNYLEEPILGQCDLLIDEKFIRRFKAVPATIYDLVGRQVYVRVEDPDDSSRPLQIGTFVT